jgi:hypothetical protein
LVFSNGVIILAGLACLLIYVYDAQLTRLIQLYVVGVFTAFTLSQAGMVRRWFRLRQEKWRRNALINGIGAVTTGIVLIIVTITKFEKGAKIVVVAIPIIVLLFLAVHRHYERVGRLLRGRGLSARQEATNTFLVLVRDLGLATHDAVAYLRAVRPERITPLYVGPTEGFERCAAAWQERAPRLGQLEMLPGADDHLVRAVRRFVRRLAPGPDEFVTVVIPELLTGTSWLQFLRSRGNLMLKTSFLFETGVVVTDIPLLPEERAQVEARSGRPVEPEFSVVLVPVSGVHDAAVRAVVYAKSLHPVAIEGIYFVTDQEEVPGVVEGWHERQIDVPLVLVEAAFRDLGDPLLAEIRRHTARADTVVTVVLPEFIPAHWWENLLHNQTAFYIKRLLLFEPQVVVTSVPFHLRDAKDLRDAKAAAAAP